MKHVIQALVLTCVISFVNCQLENLLGQEQLSILKGPFTILNAHSKAEDSQPSAIHERAGNSGNWNAGYGSNDEISGFLGVESLINPIIKLTREKPGSTITDSPLPEPVCERTYFMSPFSVPRRISANASVKSRLSPTCIWNIIGTEACIPMIECPVFELSKKNNTTEKCDEYLEIFDGNRGLALYCGNDGPQNITAANGLRDLFIKFHTTKTEGPEDPKLVNITKFNCSISCSNRDQGTPLPNSYKPKTNELCSCGKKVNENRIINGEPALQGEFPWITALVQRGTRQGFCGGALINDRMILTAAHCIKGIFMNIVNLEVLLNGHILDTLPNMKVAHNKTLPKIYDTETLNRLDAENGSLRFKLDEIIIHPLYVTETNEFDVALLRLSTPIDFANTSIINPVCLPKLGSFMRTFSTFNATVAGWGLAFPEAENTSPILQKLIVRVFPPTFCKKFYAHRVTRRSLCAGYELGGKDSCMGDSGCPLILEDQPEIWTEIGVVSWGEGCAAPENPGVYFRTTESGPWVHYHSNRNGAIWCETPKTDDNGQLEVLRNL